MKRTNWLLLGIASLMIRAAFADPTVTFTVNPLNGVLAAPQGTSTGWGYTVATDSDFILINSITFEDLSPVGTFSTPGISSATISFGAPVTVPWSAGLDGLQYDVDSSAVVGSHTIGRMILNYEWFADSLLTIDQGAFDVFATNGGAEVFAEVNVQQGTSAVPEPESVFLLGSAALALILGRKGRAKRS